MLILHLQLNSFIMKKIIYFIFTLVLITSCGKSKKDILNENIANYIKKNANVPESYQPVETHVLDTVFIDKFAGTILSINKGEIEIKKKYIADLDLLSKEFEKSKAENKVKVTQERIQKENKLITEIESENKKLEALLKDDGIAFLKVEHLCKLKTKKGDLVDDHLYILTDSDLNVKMVKEKGKDNIFQTLEYFRKNIIK
jgi:hypothetical protein